jgi:PAT family acetyl-CoA transporter-like MFS transporter 1
MGTSVSNPKFMEYGVAKEAMALVDLSLIPIKILIPIFIDKYTSGPRPLKILYKTVPYW